MRRGLSLRFSRGSWSHRRPRRLRRGLDALRQARWGDGIAAFGRALQAFGLGPSMAQALIAGEPPPPVP
jgi:hypothetical protein